MSISYKNIFWLMMCCYLSEIHVTAKPAAHKSNLSVSVKGLKGLLGDLDVLFHQTLHYHWNVEGQQFLVLHELFNKQYLALLSDMDLVAERIRALQDYANISMRDMLEHASIAEEQHTQVAADQMVRNLMDQYQHVLVNISDLIRQLSTSDDFATRKMLEDIMERYEKTVWMLTSLTK